MAYISDRVVHDADAHIMEPPNWLRDHADPDIRDRIERPGYANELAQTGDGGHDGDQDGSRLCSSVWPSVTEPRSSSPAKTSR